MPPADVIQAFKLEQYSSDEEEDVQEEEMFLRSEENMSHIFCHTCGEDIDNEEFVRNDKCYCSEECLDRDNFNLSSEKMFCKVYKSLSMSQDKISDFVRVGKID